MTTPHHLTTCSRINPFGIDAADLRFAWLADVEQSGYEMELSSGDRVVWASGRVHSTRPFGAPYNGPPLTSATAYSWRVRVHFAENVSEWSEAATFETGLLSSSDWAAQWITEPPRSKKNPPRTRYFQKAIDLPGAVVRARAYASALGWYRLFVNGEDQTGPELVPRYTPFDDVVEYQVYDVTDAVSEGRNTIGVVVSEGRFRGALGTFNKKEVYGDRLATIVHLELEFADGSIRIYGTDSSWSVGTGRILVADPKLGERVDFRLPEAPGELVPVHILPPHPRRLVAEEVDRVTQVGEFAATLSRTPAGVQLLDFGQNFNGVARIRLDGEEGTTVVVKYSEVLTPDGELELDYLEYADPNDWFQRDEVILGSDPVVYTPSFTIRGFRYATVEGIEIAAEDVTGIELSTPLQVIAQFQSSDSRLVQMATTTMASLRANFSDTATDCPTRERTGWTGDVQVFAPTAAIMVDSDAFLRRYLSNLTLEQEPDGRIPNWIPAEESDFSRGIRERALSFIKSSVGWGDASVLVPWTLYEYYGDEDVLSRQWASALAWVEQLERRARKSGLARRFGPRAGNLERFIVDTGYHYGEWLRPGENPASTFSTNVRKPPAEIATAYFALSSGVLAQWAEVLGDEPQAARWSHVASRVREAWRAVFVKEGGSRIALDRQDDYVRALEFDLLLPEQRPPAAARLAELVTAAGDHLATGFLSTPLLLQALSNNGHSDVAYRLLLQETAPSWLGQLGRGATTWWETWEGYKDDGHAKVSHDHYTFGSVTRWLHEHVAGLRPLEPAYRRFAVAPVIGGGLTSASSTVETRFGPASSSWRVEANRLLLTVAVPPGTMADVSYGTYAETVAVGTHSFDWTLDD